MPRSRIYLTACMAAMMACRGFCLPSRAQSLQYYGAFFSTSVTGVMRAAAGNFYGTTYGDNTTAGTVFQITPSGQQTLYTFSGGADGGHPDGNLAQGPDGSLYGQTDTGGANNAGTVFRLTLNGTLTTLHAFTPLGSDGTNSDGYQVAPPLLPTGDGTLYGVTTKGGAGGSGVLFKITSTGAFTVLYAFSKTASGGVNADGAFPHVGLVQGADGHLYGVTSAGGAGGTGVVFEYSTANGYQVLHAFAPLQAGANADGADPEGLFPNADGSLAGITVAGGAEQAGTLFVISASGVFSVTTPIHIAYPAPIAGAPARDARGAFYFQQDDGSGYYFLMRILPNGYARSVRTEGSYNHLSTGKDGRVYGDWHAVIDMIFGINYLFPDFHSYGLLDLVWHSTRTGKLVDMTMDGTKVAFWQDLATSTDTNWRVVGISDLETTSTYPSLLLQNKVTGDVGFMPLEQSSGVPSTILTGIDPKFQLVALPDLNGDGVPDFVFENFTTGEVVYALIGMNPGDAIYSEPIAWGDLFQHLDTHWTIVATPDLNGDGYQDLIFQNSQSGDVVYALMQGLTPVRWGYLFRGIAPAFKIVGTLNNGVLGQNTIVWQNRVTGEVVFTSMNGTTATGWTQVFKTFDLQWELFAAR